MIVDDNGSQKSPLIKELIEHRYSLSREDYFEIFGYYPDENPFVGKPVKYSQEILNLKKLI